MLAYTLLNLETYFTASTSKCLCRKHAQPCSLKFPLISNRTLGFLDSYYQKQSNALSKATPEGHVQIDQHLPLGPEAILEAQ